MVLSLYADRRTPGVVGVAHHLIQALQRTSGVGMIEFYLDDALARLPEARTLATRPRLLPGNLRSALTRLGPRDIAVVAMRSPVREQVITAFDLSQRIVVVSDPSVPSLRATQRVLKLCTDVGYPVQRTDVIITRPENPTDADCETVRLALRREVSCVLPVLPPDGAGGEDYEALAARLAGA